MEHSNNSSSGTDEVGATDQTTTLDSQFLSDVYLGLNREQKYLHCKYLYDQRGSQLFDMICELDEYYPTRTEAQITRDNASAIAQSIGTDSVLVEYGSGSSHKTRLLLDQLENPRAYLPVDISEEHLFRTAEQLQGEYPALDIQPVVADFTEGFDLPSDYADGRVCVYFPGSTIGNLEPEDSLLLLENIAWQCGPEGSLLIGFDLEKSVDVLERAYDDSDGVTAEFNLNLLRRMNRELDADFDLDQFAHVAFYNTELSRIEIYLESLCSQSVTVGDEEFEFDEGERIRTEYSHKYTVEGFAEVAAQAGLCANRVWTDEADYFALMHLSTE